MRLTQEVCTPIRPIFSKLKVVQKKLEKEIVPIPAMTPNELAAVRERYTGEKFPGLDIPMDQVGLSMKMSNYIIIKDIKYVKEDVR